MQTHMQVIEPQKQLEKFISYSQALPEQLPGELHYGGDYSCWRIWHPA